MSDQLLSDLSTSHTEILNRNLRLQRNWLLALAILGGVSAFPALPYLLSNPDYPLYDGIMQLANGVILLGAAIALFILPAAQTRRIALIAFSLVMADLTIRVILTHHMPYPSTAISREAVMVQFSPMIPAILVASFLFLESKYAITLSWLLTALTAVSVLVFQFKSGPDAWNSFEKLGITLQFVFAHPIIVILLTLICKVNKQFRIYSEYALARSSDIESTLLRDETGLLLTRPAILQLLKTRLQKRQHTGRVLLIQLKLYGNTSGQPISELRTALVTVLKTILPASTAYGALESDQIIASYTQETDFDAEDSAIYQAWRKLDNSTQLEIRSHKLEAGMTWPILLNDLGIGQ